MILFEWEFNKPSVKNEILFGKHVEFPIKTIRLGIAIITYMPDSTNRFVKEALRGLSRDRDWLIENDREMDRKQKEIWEELDKRHQESHRSDHRKMDEMRKTISDLKRAIEIVKEGV